MDKIKHFYGRLFPLWFRKGLWNFRWFWISLWTDYSSKILFLKDYETYWASREDENNFALSYHDLIELCYIETMDNARVLDFGCGAGYLLMELNKKRHIEGVGIDASEIAANLARKNGVIAYQFNLEDVDGLKQFGTFDVAIASEVLEHIVEAEMVLIALSKVANKVLISIPNTGYFHYRLRLLFGRFPRQWIIHPAEHVRFWTCADFKYMTKIAGYEVQKLKGVGEGYLAKWFPCFFAPSLFFVLLPIDK